MKTKEFNLSEKRFRTPNGTEGYYPKDIKEFIKRLKEKIKNVNTHKTPHIFYLKDKLAGDKLI